MKVFMLWDMEGVSGLWRREQVWYWEDGVSAKDEEEGKQLLMADIESAVRAALAAGVDELIVCDTHHGGGNIRPAEMMQDPRVTLRDSAREKRGDGSRWMPGLDETVDGLMLPGHHAKAGTPNAFLPHTWMGDWADFRINGQSVGELGIESCFAGYFDVPLILMQGDETSCREAEEQFPGVVTAAVKRAVSRDFCTGLAAETARALTGLRVVEAIDRLRTDKWAPMKPTLPMVVQVKYWRAEAAAKAAERSGARRVDAHTIEQTVERQCDVVKWIVNAGLE